jgi:hypothetical protein
MAASTHITNVNGPIADELKGSAKRLNDNLVIDEWSCALTSDSLKAESDPQGAQSTFCRTEMGVYSRVGGGWSFWSNSLLLTPLRLCLPVIQATRRRIATMIPLGVSRTLLGKLSLVLSSHIKVSRDSSLQAKKPSTTRNLRNAPTRFSPDSSLVPVLGLACHL